MVKIKKEVIIRFQNIISYMIMKMRIIISDKSYDKFSHPVSFKLILDDGGDWKPFTFVLFGRRKFVNFDPPTFNGLVIPFE